MQNVDLAKELLAEVFDDDLMSTSPEAVNLVQDLLLELSTTPDVVPTGLLAEFIGVSSLPAQPSVAPAQPILSARAKPARSRKVITGISAFVATTVGKVVLGTAIAAASVGGAHAAQIVDVPGLPDIVSLAVEDEVEPSVDAVEPEPDTAVDEVPVDVGDDTPIEDSTHGQDVSEFVETTELEGCERGQAIAEVASANAPDHAQSDERSNDPCADDDGEADQEADAEEADAEEAVEEDSGRPDDAGKPDDVGPPEHANNPEDSGKPEDAGKPEDTGRPEDAGNPEDTGRPEDAGKPEDTGRPEDAGKPEDTGRPEDAGPPADAGALGKPEDAGRPEDAGKPEDAGALGNSPAEDVGRPDDAGPPGDKGRP